MFGRATIDIFVETARLKLTNRIAGNVHPCLAWKLHSELYYCHIVRKTRPDSAEFAVGHRDRREGVWGLAYHDAEIKPMQTPWHLFTASVMLYQIGIKSTWWLCRIPAWVANAVSNRLKMNLVAVPYSCLVGNAVSIWLKIEMMPTEMDVLEWWCCIK